MRSPFLFGDAARRGFYSCSSPRACRSIRSWAKPRGIRYLIHPSGCRCGSERRRSGRPFPRSRDHSESGPRLARRTTSAQHARAPRSRTTPRAGPRMAYPKYSARDRRGRGPAKIQLHRSRPNPAGDLVRWLLGQVPGSIASSQPPMRRARRVCGVDPPPGRCRMPRWGRRGRTTRSTRRGISGRRGEPRACEPSPAPFRDSASGGSCDHRADQSRRATLSCPAPPRRH